MQSAVYVILRTRMPHAAVGILLVLTSATAFGSFGVPIKSKRVLEAQVPPHTRPPLPHPAFDPKGYTPLANAHAQVEPVIVQCYKTATCFATCWLALLLTDFTFTPWGIVGGLIWVRECVSRACVSLPLHITSVSIMLSLVSADAF